jgi:PAS domain S-box-containing protein
MTERYKIMIVDDNPSLCELVSEALIDDYDIYKFHSGEDALENIEEVRPHVLLLDIMMPGINGYDVCRKIRVDNNLPNLKILFLSAKSSIQDKLAGYEAKGDDYLVKPFDCDELRAKVQVYIRLTEEEEKRKQAEEQLRASEDKYRSLVENSPDIIIHANRSGNILFSNKEFSPKHQGSIPCNIFELVPKESHEIIKNAIEKVFNTGKVTSIETKNIDQKGNKTWYSTRIGPIIKSGKVDGVTLFSREITNLKQIEYELREHKQGLEKLVKERTRDLIKTNDHLKQEIVEKKQAKNNLHKSEEKYRNILESIEEGYYELDMDGKLTFLNNSLSSILETPANKLLKRNIVLQEDTINFHKLNTTLEYVNSTGNPSPVIKWELPLNNGTSKFLETSISLIREGSAKVGFRGIVRDITERHAHEKTLEGLFKHAVGTLARAAEVFDQDTGDHTVRIGDYSQLLSSLAGMNEQYQKDIRISAQLHDVGKIHITSSILNKAGRLTAEEFESIKNHTLYGSIIIGKNPDFKMANEIAMFHHEKWNGSGYPDGLKGRAIPLAARITAIVDVFDALVSKRSYKRACSYEDARQIISGGDIRLNPGHSFDPGLLKIFLDNYELFVAIHKKSLEIELESDKQQLSILILDDDKELVDAICEHFQDMAPFCKVFEFNTIVAMTEYLNQNATFQPHLCFLDVNLPDGSGHEAAEDIKSRFPDAHLICITAEDDIDISKVNLYGHRVFRKHPHHIHEFMDNLVKTAEIIKEHHYNPIKL